MRPHRSWRQRRLQGLQERLIVRRSVVPGAVDEESRRAVDSAADAAPAVLHDARRDLPFLKVLPEALQIQAELLGPDGKDVRLEEPLPVVEQVVHLPKLALQG